MRSRTAFLAVAAVLMLLGARPALATGRPNGHGAWYYPHVAGPQGVVYSLYIPDRYSPNRGGYPMVLFCSSNSVDQGWGYWHTIIETLGVIYAAPLNAGNNVPATRRIEMVALTLADVRKRVNIDPNRTYCSGFSGGGKVASEVAFSFAPYFGGVIPVSGSEVVEPLDASQARLSVAIITGSADFNQKYEVANSQRDRQVGLRTRLWNIPRMPHAQPPPVALMQAYQWMEADVARRRQVKFLPMTAIDRENGRGLLLYAPFGWD